MPHILEWDAWHACFKKCSDADQSRAHTHNLFISLLYVFLYSCVSVKVLCDTMSNYPKVPNPMLSPARPPPNQRGLLGRFSTSTSLKGLSSASTASFKNFFSKSFHQLSSASSYIRPAASKRIGPASITSDTRKQDYDDDAIYKNTLHFAQYHNHVLKKSSPAGLNEPIIYYNGPWDTLDELPDDKLEWIKNEPVTTEGLRHPLTDCSGSIVFRKPVTRSQTLYDNDQRKGKRR